jgi:hypothetical protein
MRGPPPKSKPAVDQPLLAVVGLGLIIFGIVLIGGGFSDTRQFAGYPLVLIGVLVLVLRSFHPRLHLVKLFNKIELGLTPESDENAGTGHRTSERPVRQLEARTPSLREVSKAAKNPDTERHRRG